MGELIEYGKKTLEYGNYADFKQTMDTVVEEVEEGFVKIGYLLKVARDTAVLQESGCATVSYTHLDVYKRQVLIMFSQEFLFFQKQQDEAIRIYQVAVVPK